jgi:hypothetical protein
MPLLRRELEKICELSTNRMPGVRLSRHNGWHRIQRDHRQFSGSVLDREFVGHDTSARSANNPCGNYLRSTHSGSRPDQ